MVEGARLESVYAGNRIWGSNPHLSAIFKLKADISAFFLARSSRKMRSHGENTHLNDFIDKAILIISVKAFMFMIKYSQ